MLHAGAVDALVKRFNSLKASRLQETGNPWLPSFLGGLSPPADLGDKMTQDIQPLTWQKRTNLEEHQQFFSKINEIIDNLAPTMDEAEAAIAQAQTAVATVAGYDTRLTAVEGEADTNAANIAKLQGRMGTAEGNIRDLESRVSATESRNKQQDDIMTYMMIDDEDNLKISHMNEYVVGLTGIQDILGVKQFIGDGYLRMRTPNVFFYAGSTVAHNADRGNQSYLLSGFFNDADGNPILRLCVQELADGKLHVYMDAFNTSDVQVSKTLGIFNYTTGQWEA